MIVFHDTKNRRHGFKFAVLMLFGAIVGSTFSLVTGAPVSAEPVGVANGCTRTQTPAEQLTMVSGSTVADWDLQVPLLTNDSPWAVYATSYLSNGSVHDDCVVSDSTNGSFEVGFASAAFADEFAYHELTFVFNSFLQYTYELTTWMVDSGVVMSVVGTGCGGVGIAPLQNFSTTTVSGSVVTSGSPVEAASVVAFGEAHSIDNYVCVESGSDGAYSVVIPTFWIGTALISAQKAGAEPALSAVSGLIPAPGDGGGVTLDLSMSAVQDLAVGVNVLDHYNELVAFNQTWFVSVCLHAGDPKGQTPAPAIRCAMADAYAPLTAGVAFDLSTVGATSVDVVPTHVSVYAASSASDYVFNSSLLPPQGSPWQTLITAGGTRQFALASCSSTSSPDDVSADASTTYVTGTVVDAESVPVPGARVSLGLETNAASACVMTTADGYFALPYSGQGTYTVVVDPPSGAALGSNGYQAVLGTDSPSATQVTLFSSGFSTSMSGTMVPFTDGGEPDPLAALVCLVNPQNMALTSCGRIHDRNVGWELSFPPDTDLTSLYLFYAYAFDSGVSSDFLAAGFLPRERVRLYLFDGQGSPGGGGGSGPNYACSEGQTPVVSGNVTAAGAPYPTSVSVRFANVAPGQVPDGWSTSDWGITVATDENGAYAICNFENGGGGFHAIAESTSRGSGATYGDTASRFVPSSETGPYVLDIAMAAPTIAGTASGASEVAVMAFNSRGDWTSEFARVSTDENGAFAAAVPFKAANASLNGKYRILATNDYDQSGSELVPTRLIEDVSFPFAESTGTALLSLSGSPAQPTVRGTIRGLNGVAIADDFEHWINVDVQKQSAGCPIGEDRVLLEADGCIVDVGRSSRSKFSLKVTDGTYYISLYSSNESGLPPTAGLFTVTNDQITAVAPNMTAPSTETNGRLLVDFAAGDIGIRVVDELGNPVSGAEVSAQLWNGNGYSYPNIQPTADASGVSWGPSQIGTYQLRLKPPTGSRTLAETLVVVKVADSNDGKKTITNTCTWDDTLRDFVCTGEPPSSATGPFDLVIKPGDALIDVCQLVENTCVSAAVSQPGGGVAQPEIEVHRITFNDQDQRTNSTSLFRNAVNFGGTAFRLEPPAGVQTVFEFVVHPPYGNPSLLAAQKLYVLVDLDGEGDNDGWWSCVGAMTDGRNPCAGPDRGTVALTPTDGVHDLGMVELKVADLIGTVKNPAGQVVSQSWVAVSKISPCPGNANQECSSYLISQDSNGAGQFPLDVEPGLYELTARPPWNDRTGLSEGTLRIEVMADGDDGVLYSVPSPIEVVLAEPNIEGRVMVPGDTPTPRSWVGLGVEKQINTGVSTEWVPTTKYTNTDRLGNYRIYLGEGTWRLVAWPQGADDGLYTRAEVVVVVDSTGVVVSVDGAAHVNGDPIDVVYGRPNISGSITDVGGQPVSWSGVGAERWNQQQNRWEHVTWTNTTQTGAYAINLALADNTPEWFRLTVHPSSAGALRTSRYIYSSSDHTTLCFVPSRGSTDCLPGQGFSITLDGPNFLGVVLGDNSGRAAWVNARKWNDVTRWFDWVDLWADARPGSGQFGLKLDPGDYEIVAEPRVGSGFAKASRYLRINEDDSVCEFTFADNSPSVDCNPVSLVSDRVPIVLTGANLLGTAKYLVDGNPRNLTEGWVEIFDVVTQGESEWTEWRDSVGINQQGEFAMSVSAPAGSTRLIEVVVNPSNWNPGIAALGLSKTKIRVLATESAGVTSLCRADQSGTACEPNTTIDSVNKLNVTMSTGNLTGVVRQPASTCTPTAEVQCTVQDSQIQLQKWDSTSQYWQWTNEWAHTNSTGGFSMQLDPGVYRVTARPPWGDTSSAAGDELIRVEANGWCVVAVVDGDCSGGYSNLLDMNLSSPNLTGTVLSAGQGVANTWVGVERLVGTAPNSYWRWTELGGSTSWREGSIGNFSLNVMENGTYRLVVDPPWNAPEGSTYVRFSREFTVASGVVSWSDGGTGDSSFPSPNLTFTVTDGTAGVRDAWIYVEKSTGANSWQWADIHGGTRAGGRISLMIPKADDGDPVTSDEIDTYRITVNSPWNRTGLPRFTRSITVDASGVVAWSSSEEVALDGSISTRFPSSNVMGRIDITTGTPNRWGWLEVYNADGLEWLEGTNLSQSGRFSFFLADATPNDASPTTYRLRAHPNYALSSGLPIDLEVRVTDSGSGSVLTGWNYLGDATERCTDSPCSIEAALDFVTPNISIDVSLDGGAALAGAFVRLRQCADGELAGSCTGSAYTLVTDGRGEASALLPDGTYDLVVTALVNGAVRRSTAQLVTLSSVATSVPVTVPNS